MDKPDLFLVLALGGLVIFAISFVLQFSVYGTLSSGVNGFDWYWFLTFFGLWVFGFSLIIDGLFGNGIDNWLKSKYSKGD